MLKVKNFRQIAAPITWIIAEIFLLLIFVVVFQSTTKEIMMLAAVELIILNPVVFFADPIVFCRIFPDCRSYFFGIRHDEVANYSVKQRREMLTSLMRFPGRRALYGLVVSLLYKVPPAVFLIVFVWNYDVSVTTQFVRTALLFSLIYAYFCAQTYLENHELVSDVIADLHQRHDWSEAFRGYHPPISRQSFQRTEAIALAVVWLLVLGLQASVLLMHEPSSRFPLFVQNTVIGLTGLSILTRMWFVSRRFFYNGLEHILRTFGSVDFSKPSPTLALHSSPFLAQFEQTFNLLMARLRGAERELSAVITREADRYRFQSLGEVSAMISHDLANPLGVILFCAEVGMEDPNRLTQPRYLHKLHENAKHALELIESLRAYLRNPTEGRQQTTFSEAHRHVVRLLSFQSDMSLIESIELEKDPADEAYLIAMPRSDLIQVLYNLYSNAMANFVQAKIADPRLVVTPRLATIDMLSVNIADNGSGLSKRRFEDMTAYSLLATSEQAREGLGLRLTRRLVERHGGSLDVLENAMKDRGTTFELRLKIKQDTTP